MLDTKESPAIGDGEAESTGHDGICDQLNSELSRKQQEQLLAEFGDAGDRCDANAQIAEWIIDYTARLKRRQIEFLYADCRVGACDLQAEFERLVLAIKLLKKLRERS
jgi:hypothetical protein